MDNYERLFEAVKKNFKSYSSLTFEEFLDSDDDKKKAEFFEILEKGAESYFKGEKVGEDFKEAFDAYFQADNSDLCKSSRL